MQLGAINTAIPSFKSKVITSQDEVDEITRSLETLNDSFSKAVKSKKVNEDSENNKDSDKKNVLGIAASVGAGAIVMCAAAQFFAGKCIQIPMFAKIPNLMEKAFKGISNQAVKLSSTLQGTDKKALNLVGSGIGKAEEFAKNLYKTDIKGVEGTADKAFIKLAGLTGAIFGTKALVETDGNGDGISDIAQKSQNAYAGMLQNAQALDTVVKLLA